MATAKKTPQSNPISQIESQVLELRGRQVLLDSDLAQIYGVETRDINKAVRNNKAKFPRGYVLTVSKSELKNLRWKFSTANLAKSRVPPKAFTEKGLYMLATILKSKQATKATLQIVETFAKLRQFSKVAKSLVTEKDAAKRQNLVSQGGALIGDILNQEFAHETSTETTIELNLAMFKIKHRVRNQK